MPRRYLSGIFLCALLWGFLLPTSAEAGSLLGWLGGCRHHPPAYVGNPKRIVAAPPGPHRYAEHGPHHYPEYNVYGPWYGYGFGVPTYQWGYFGARYRPVCITHKGYYGDFSQWSYRQGY